jgi:hypothetical protein
LEQPLDLWVGERLGEERVAKEGVEASFTSKCLEFRIGNQDGTRDGLASCRVKLRRASGTGLRRDELGEGDAGRLGNWVKHTEPRGRKPFSKGGLETLAEINKRGFLMGTRFTRRRTHLGDRADPMNHHTPDE